MSSQPATGRSAPVFLSYAREDADVSLRIAQAMRSAGIEVWTAHDELRGGDEWNLAIRRQIRECALFIPIISANTRARTEGYFRLEWHLAEQRSLNIAKGRPFIAPAAVDGTSERDAPVPQAFLSVPWTRLAGDESFAAFAVHVKELLRASASAPPFAPTPSVPHVADYQLLRIIGRGSYGDVWLARGVTGIFRAVKIVWRDRFADSQPFEREFNGLREFAAMSLDEPIQLALLHVGRDDSAGYFYYVMELADDADRGRDIDPAHYVPLTLTELRKRRGRLPARECIGLGVELAQVLACLHTRGLVHRDIKPSNVILVGGVPKLVDIGLVAATADARTFVGTEGFVPPEGPGTPAADVFALGKLLYELLTGLDRQEYPELPPEVSQSSDRRGALELNEIILRACDPVPERRYLDASSILADLLVLQSGSSVRRRRLSAVVRRDVGMLALVGAAACAALVFWKPWRKPANPAAPASQAAALRLPAPPSEARQLAQRSEAVWENIAELTSEKLGAAEELNARALVLDPGDAEAWADAARLDAWMAHLHFDRSQGRREKAQNEAARAVSLAPNSVAARHAQACVLAFAFESAAMRSEAEKTYRALARECPDDKSLMEEYGIVLRDNGRFDEAAAVFERNGLLLDTGWNYYFAGRFDDADKVADRLLSQGHTLNALMLKAQVGEIGFEDLDRAKAAVNQFTPEELLSDAGTLEYCNVYMMRREPDNAIRVLNDFPREVLMSIGFFGFKELILGIAYEMAGRPEAAQAAWRAALKQVQERLKANSTESQLLADEAYLLACLGDAEEAGRVLRLYQSLKVPGPLYDFTEAYALLRLGRKEEALAKISPVLHEQRTGWQRVHRDARYWVIYDPLRGDPQFEKLLRDTLPKNAKPFDEPAARAAPAPGSGR
ncbi:MAG: TIR domain-containing protein [Opitutaceae bacterium]